MSQILNFFIRFEALIYFILGLGSIPYIYRFATAWQQYRESVFGLEREVAQRKLNQATVALFLLLVTGVAVFSLVTYVVPAMPVSMFAENPTNPAPNGEALLEVSGTIQPAATTGLETATPLPTISISSEGCVPGMLEIVSPSANDTIRGEVQVIGTVNIENFGFYKFEVARVEVGLWQTVLAGREIVIDSALVEIWDTSRFPPGQYVLQLIATDNDGDELPPCRVPVTIAEPTS